MIKLLLGFVFAVVLLGQNIDYRTQIRNKPIASGTSAPSSGSCDATNEVGTFYVRTDNPATNPTRVYVCTKTGASSFAWDHVAYKTGITAPATCTVGDTFFDTDAPAGSNWFGCTSTNTYTLMSGVGGVATSLFDVDIRLIRSATEVLTLDDGAAGPVMLDVLGLISASEQFIVPAAGQYTFNTRGVVQAPADGVFTLLNFAQTDFGRLNFGGTTASFPALKRSSTGLEMRLADDSNYAPFTASVYNASTGYRIAGAATTGNVLRGNGTNFVSAQLSFSDLGGAAVDGQIPNLNALSTGLTVSRCVETDGSGLLVSAAGLCGVGTGAAMAAADFTPTRTSNTILDFPAIAASTYRVGEVSCAAVAAAEFTVTSGTGTLWIAVGSDCALTVRHNIVGTCDANCTAVASSTGFLPGDLPLYQWTVTTDVLAATGTLKLTPYASRPLVAGTNVSFGHTAGVTTINSTGGGEIYTYDTTNSLYRFTCSNGAFSAAVGTYASLPTCTSGTIQAYSHGIAVTRPVAAASWTALQSATLADSVGAVTFAGTLNGKEFQGLARPVLTAPYTITLGMDVSAFGDQSGCTVGWSNGTAATSEAHTLYIDFTSTSAVEKYVGVNRWNDLDIDGFVSADLTGVAYSFLGSTVFVKLEDNNTNRIYSISPNGIDWHELLSIARTTHITPTHFLAACYSATGLGKKGTVFHVVEDDQ